MNAAQDQTPDDTITVPREVWDRMCTKLSVLEKTMAEVRTDVHHMTGSPYTPILPNGHPERPGSEPLNGVYDGIPIDPGIQAPSGLTGETVHLGASSIPALVLALSKGSADHPEVQDLLGRSMLPLFGLDNESATYPFVDLWGLPSMSRINELCKALPSDSELVNLFRLYRDAAHIVYPALIDVEGFETELMQFLITRRGRQQVHPDSISDQIYGRSIHWVGLLFAALASGCQSSHLPRKERELTAQVYTCCSFECLRLTNFFARPTIETIQTLLILGNVLSNNMNAGVAWALIGLTMRLAQSLGIHTSSQKSSNGQTSRPSHGSRVWWMVIWCDGLLSISYDRASFTAAHEGCVPVTSPPGQRSYSESMQKLSKLALDIVQHRTHDADQGLARITEQKHAIDQLMIDAADHLRDVRLCRSVREQVEHWALYLHVSYIRSELCRHAISPSAPRQEMWQVLKQTCINSLMDTVDAFLGLQRVSIMATRSWAALHRALSSAILLGILREPSHNVRAANLLENIINVMSDITANVDPSELSAPIMRSIGALKKLSARPIMSGESAESGNSDGIGAAGPPAGGTGHGGMWRDCVKSEFVGMGRRDDRGFDGGHGAASDGSGGGDGGGERETPSPLAYNYSDEGTSPYALLDSILWG